MTFSGFSHNSQTKNIITDETSYNGKYCIKITPYDDYAIVRVPYNFDSSKTYLFEAYCKNTVNNAHIETRTNSGFPTHTLVLPVLDEFYKYSLEFTPNNNETMVIFRTYNTEGSLYVDEIRLTIK